MKKITSAILLLTEAGFVAYRKDHSTPVNSLNGTYSGKLYASESCSLPYGAVTGDVTIRFSTGFMVR